MNKIVAPSQVIVTVITSAVFVNRMAATLRRQGQIEPLQVRPYAPGLYTTFDDDAWGNELATAAQQLGWSTLLVSVAGLHRRAVDNRYCAECAKDTK